MAAAAVKTELEEHLGVGREVEAATATAAVAQTEYEALGCIQLEAKDAAAGPHE